MVPVLPGIRIGLRRTAIYFSRRRALLGLIFVGHLSLMAVFSIVGERGLMQSYRLWRETKNLDREIQELTVTNRTLRTSVDLFRTDMKTIERYARRELRLAGENEIQYIFK